MKTIHIMAAKDMPQQVRLLKPAAVLSIEHPGVALDHDGRAPRLTQEHNIRGTAQFIQSYWDTEDEMMPNAPTERDVHHGLYFLLHHADVGEVAVHCRRGKSRSVAMGLAFLAAANKDVAVSELIEHLKIIRPEAAPNILIVRYADRILGLRGALEAAVLRDPQLSQARYHADMARRAWAEANPGFEKIEPAIIKPGMPVSKPAL